VNSEDLFFYTFQWRNWEH